MIPSPRRAHRRPRILTAHQHLIRRVGTVLSGDLFAKNQFRMRVECRYRLKVGRPGAFVKVTTA